MEVKKHSPRSNNSFTSLIETSLKLWIKTKCNSIKDLSLEINTSPSNLLKGHVSQVNLEASKVDFKGIIIDKINICAEGIKLKLLLYKLTPKVSLSKEFHIDFEILLSKDGINKIISSEKWSWIRSWFKKEFSLNYHFKILGIRNNLLILQTLNSIEDITIEKNLSIKVINGTLEISDIASKKTSLFPMDESINIKEATTDDNSIRVKCSSKVTP
ncbi:LmeA family phospholipid-binding protein [Prochlorococcus marinus]|uniref:DUF2993 domain-containing protein n=1 Tax=Prochlorococcus marinus (strain MIT 9211) TaxID=93059 RepID=A9BB19_PROM4|nr:LmeA family phospholipid-binding protein [Prochlorococcus marinus]ABX09031.1 Hypothetical protein P9211_11001 [Prochlorococcus marinus str. MIT 9211]